MKAFADLFDAIDRTTSTNAKVTAMRDYFARVDPASGAWAVFFLTGRRFKRLLPVRRLVEWTAAITGLPGWLLEESYATVGDLAETIALLLDRGAPAEVASELPLHRWIEERIQPLRRKTPEEQRAEVTRWWDELPVRELFLVNKLLTGGFRVGVSQTLVTRALAQVAGLPAEAIAHRLMGEWEPSAAFFMQLVHRDVSDGDLSRPYPFFLASALAGQAHELGPVTDWQAEWKWDGIRAQLVKRAGRVFLWSRGEELVTDRFPEIGQAAAALEDGVVLDGEILAFAGDAPLPFAALQQRIGRRKLSAKVLREVPVVFMAYDLLEDGGADVREWPLAQRRVRLEALVAALPASVFRVSPVVQGESWEALARLRSRARELNVEGLMLKHLGSPYRSGRRKGEWWKWKIDPYSVDAVLIYAQPGNGRRANLYTDYTFGVWDGDHLTPIAKAYSGLSNEEIAELDRWVRRHTIEKFGPVRAVEQQHVFELHFEAIAESTRHKSGIAVRFPRIARWRTDKAPPDANTLDDLRALL